MEGNFNSDNRNEKMMTAEKDKKGCCKIIPRWFWGELKRILKLAWPLVLTAQLQFGLSTISLIFAGHLGTTQQGGIALANSLYNVASQSIASGATTACDTFFAQTFGSGNKKMVGVHLQRSVMICILMCFPIWAFLINGQQIFLLLGQEPEIAKISGDFIIVATPAILMNFLFKIQQKYLVNLNNVLPLLVVSLCGVGVSIGINYYFVDVLQLGPTGVSIAFTLGYTTFALFTFCYIFFSGFYKATWGGFSKESFHDWGAFTKVALAGMLMLSLEWLGFETGTILAGYIGETELATVAILFQVQASIHMFYILTSVACGVRLGQELGKGDAKRAKRVTYVVKIISVTISTIVVIVILSLDDIIPTLFTADAAVHAMVSENLLLLIPYFFLGGIAISHAGLLRGSGRQKQGALTIFIGFYIFGLPIGIPLMLLTALQIKGYWIGLTIAETVVGIVYVTIIYKTNWKVQIELAQIRAGLVEKTTKKETKETCVDDENANEKTSLLENSDDSNYGMSTAMKTIDKRPVTGRLLLKRLFTVLGLMGILGISVMIKIFVPPPALAAGTDCTLSNNSSSIEC